MAASTRSPDNQCPEEIIQRLFQLYRDQNPGSDIAPAGVVSEGFSQATVRLVQLKRPYGARRQLPSETPDGLPHERDPQAGSRHSVHDYDGVAFAKIDRDARCQEEWQRHQRAYTAYTKEFMPAIIGKPVGPVGTTEEGWSLVLYEPAQQSIAAARSLGLLMGQDATPRIDQLAGQVRALVGAIARYWHQSEGLDASRHPYPLAELVTRMCNRGDQPRIEELDERLREVHLPGKGQRELQFMPGKVIAPNPYAYLFGTLLWLQNGTSRMLITPLAPCHGDLHAGNIICRLDRDGQLAQTTVPWLIDLAQFEEALPPFFDLAYMELDLLLRWLPTETKQQWSDWQALTAYLTTGIEPAGTPAGMLTSAAWTLVEPIRQHLATLVAHTAGSPGIPESYEQAWWLSAALVGALVARRRKVEASGQRPAALLYGARSLERLLTSLPDQSLLHAGDQLPAIVWWPVGPASKRARSRRATAPEPEQMARTPGNRSGTGVSSPRAPVYFLPDSLPAGYIERPAALERARDALLDDAAATVGIIASDSATAAVQGQGGLGKTVLARALCDDPAVRAAFPDGILWAKLTQPAELLGQAADPQQRKAQLLGHQRDWIRRLGGDIAAANTIESGKVEVRELLRERAMLLVLDNVWEAEDVAALAVKGPRCRVLMTTRDATLAGPAELVPLDVMAPEESWALLRASSKGRLTDANLAARIATRLGHLPLALEIVGTMVRDGVPWSDIEQALDEGDLAFVEHVQGSVLAAIGASVRSLPLEEQPRYHELVIFARGEPLVETVVARLWDKTAGLRMSRTRGLLVKLRMRSLVQKGNTLHDLQYDYLRAVMPPDDQQRLHGVLADAYAADSAWMGQDRSGGTRASSSAGAKTELIVHFPQ
jgi:hypothetical protein